MRQTAAEPIDPHPIGDLFLAIYQSVNQGTSADYRDRRQHLA